MSTMLYWGQGGRYGPFEVQNDGWPHAGQVMRHFREKANLTAKAFGKLYGHATREDGKPVCERWILEMELENRVPTDIVRRRIIARLLDIPPALLGLASLADITAQPQSETPSASSTKRSPKKIPTDTVYYEKNLHVTLQLHRTTQAQDLLESVNQDRQALERFCNHVKGDLLNRMRELLVSNDLLAAKIVRDQRDYAHAYSYTNHAVQVATEMHDEELVATSTYTRGCIQLQWGQFGVMKQGRFQHDRKNIGDAIHDFQDILHSISSSVISLHPQLQGFTLLQLARAYSLLTRNPYGTNATHALTCIERAAELVGREAIDDLSTRMIVTGTLSGLHLGGYYLTSADILSTVGLFDDALDAWQHFDKQTERTYEQDETRNHAWRNIVHAKVLLGLREYDLATESAKNALVACHAIHSLQNIAIILDLHSKLVTSSYGTSKNVEALGEMLANWYGSLHTGAV